MSEPIKSFRDLIAWQKAVDLGLFANEVTSRFPDHEKYGLTAAIRRNAFLIASQIADGYGQQNSGEFIRHLRQARGTIYVVDTQMMFAVRLGYLPEDTHRPVSLKVEEVAKVLSGLLRSLDR